MRMRIRDFEHDPHMHSVGYKGGGKSTHLYFQQLTNICSLLQSLPTESHRYLGQTTSILPSFHTTLYHVLVNDTYCLHLYMTGIIALGSVAEGII